MLGTLLDAASVALRDLASLDDAIFNRLLDSGVQLHKQDPASLFPLLFASTFAGMQKLLSHLQQFWLLGASAAPVPEEDLDFDFPMEENLGGLVAPQVNVLLALNDVDIEGLVDAISPVSPINEFDLFDQLRTHVGSIDYGLKRTGSAAQAVLDDALGRGALHNELMGELDEARNAASDGIFALVAAVCQTFLPNVNAGTLLPEYHSQLQEALQLRWSLSQLAREVARHNTMLQRRDTPRAWAEAALLRLVHTLDSFTKSPAFHVMRPSDRWEIVNFQRALASKNLNEVSQTCEGLDKYLESLHSINQREVLIQHDSAVMKEVRDLLEAAESLMPISVSGAGSQVRQALHASGKLQGRSRELDQLLAHVGLGPPSLADAPTVERFIQLLLDALRT
jgi:hypothetical protein